jgi:hypothetical protein
VLLPVGTAIKAQELPQKLPKVSFTSPEFETGSLLENTTGHVDLVWAPQEENPAYAALSYQLVSSATKDFSNKITHYKGPDMRSFISGLEGRPYYFRVRAVGPNEKVGPWSETLGLEVKYVSEGRVKLLMLIGALCLLSTILIIVGGSLKARNTYQPQS